LKARYREKWIPGYTIWLDAGLYISLECMMALIVGRDGDEMPWREKEIGFSKIATQ